MSNLADRPLLDTDRDRPLFVGREAEIKKVTQAAEVGLNTLLLAGRGMGKTSLLRRVMWDLRRRNRPFVQVSGAMANDPQEFVDMVGWALGYPRQVREPGLAEQLQQLEGLPFLSGRTRPVGRPDWLATEIRALGDRMREKQKDTSPTAVVPVVLVDDAEPEITHTVFGRARDEVWNLPVVWIIAGDEAQAGEYLRPPADSFFGRTITLPPLSVEESRSVLSARAGDVLAPPVIDAIAAQGKGSPRSLIRLAQEVVLGERKPDDVLAREHERQKLLDQLGEPARRLFEVMSSMGSASAADPRLLAQLGWTRSRAAQVFAELEKAGLVGSATERPPGTVGRPRKVYRVV
jgi:hypothetical protein